MEGIGILTAGGRNGAIGGNLAHFRQLGRLGHELGQHLALFNVNRDGTVTSYRWSSHKDAFVSRPALPMPPVLYNRIPSRPLERLKVIQDRFLDWREQGYVITNPHFLNKWELAQIWREHDHVRKYLLKTEQLLTRADLERWAHDEEAFYIKPISGKAGLGMMHVYRRGAGYRVREQQKGRLLDYGNVSLPALDLLLRRHFRYGRYLLQEEAYVANWGDRRFDLRMILHREPNAGFSVTGMAARSAPQGSVTTHVPNGGTRAEAKRVLTDVYGNRQDAIQSIIARVGVAAANAIAQTPGIWTELSLDMSLTPDGRPIVFEANAKPMKFDEKDIDQYGKRRLLASLTSLAQRMESQKRV